MIGYIVYHSQDGMVWFLDWKDAVDYYQTVVASEFYDLAKRAMWDCWMTRLPF